MTVRIVLFEDQATAQLYPITLGRPAYHILCGAARLSDLISPLGAPTTGVVRDHLREIQRLDFPGLASEPSPWVEERRAEADSNATQTLWINARLVPRISSIASLAHWIQQGDPGVVYDQPSVAAALLPRSLQPEGDPPWSVAAVSEFLQQLPPELARPQSHQLPLLHYPHDVVRWNGEILVENLSDRLKSGIYRQVQDGLFAADQVQIDPTVTVDASRGPILVDQGARVGPFVCLEGPLSIGPRSRVIEHAAIKHAVSIGHTAKIGGEVESSVIESYTNKQHHGFLGHSYLGSWINLGAGTCNSDLKNTYGEVKMEYQGRRVSTGMQFLGCVMGDYAKTAINTGIFTGKLIGVCSMLYGFVTTNVPSFVNYARLFGQVSELPPKVMIATQQRMFQRREVTQRPCDCRLIHDMYHLTDNERRMGGDPLAL